MQLGLPDEIQDMGHDCTKKNFALFTEVQIPLGILCSYLPNLITLMASKNFRSRRTLKSIQTTG